MLTGTTQGNWGQANHGGNDSFAVMLDSKYMVSESGRTVAPTASETSPPTSYAFRTISSYFSPLYSRAPSKRCSSTPRSRIFSTYFSPLYARAPSKRCSFTSRFRIFSNYFSPLYFMAGILRKGIAHAIGHGFNPGRDCASARVYGVSCRPLSAESTRCKILIYRAAERIKQ